MNKQKKVADGIRYILFWNDLRQKRITPYVRKALQEYSFHVLFYMVNNLEDIRPPDVYFTL
ncbi:hypothetical protein TUM17580_05360 [Citrobacter farmeri]|nr:hypothetical protein TUM17580_05360 [Citrobacter farmeri]